MESVRYAERAVTLFNARLDTLEDVHALLAEQHRMADRYCLADHVAEKDGQALRRFQRELRAVFEHATAGDAATAVGELNGLLGKHPITPHIAGNGPGTWHLHVSAGSSTVAEVLVAEALLGLAFLACDRGPGRLGTCQASGCDAGFIDTSPNRSRRYCSDRCSSRANVAAYRARRKATGRNAIERDA